MQGVTLLGLLAIKPGAASFIPLTIVISIYSVFTGAAAVLAPSILGDIVDYDTLKTGAYRAGNYFALYSLVNKIVVAIGGGAGMIFLGLVGYDVAHPERNGPDANAAMVWTFVLVPVVLRLASLAVLKFYPLDARRQDIIRRRLEQREARARRLQAAAPGSGSR